MLDKNKLIDLNMSMLALGVPDHKDDMGYNQPDYMKMRGLAYMPAITDLMAYAICDSLKHYKNTQLKSYGKDIDETLDYYKNILKEKVKEWEQDTSMFRDAYIKYCIENKVHDFMTLVSYDADSLTIHFNGFVKELNDFKDSHKDKVRAVRDDYGNWNTRIKWDFVDEYMAYAVNAGRGYVPDKGLQDVIDNKLCLTRQLMEEAKKPLAIEYEVKESNGISLSIDTSGEIRKCTYERKQEIKDALYADRNISGIHKGFDGKIYFRVPEAYLEKCATYLAGNLNLEMTDNLKNEISKYKALITSDYKLNIPPEEKLPFKPYPFQIEDAQTLISKPRMLLGHDMGLGKTFIASLVGQSIEGRKIVIAPETLRLNWKKELKRVYPDADVKCCTNKSYEIGKDWTIMGYRTAVKYLDDILKEDYSCVFVDEAHNIKAVNNYGNPTSQRAKAAMEICNKAKYVYPMTGTPIPTHNKDLYNLLHLLRCPIAESFYKYAYAYCDAYNNGYGMNATGNSRSDELHEYLRENMIRRTKKEVLPNLTKMRSFIPVEVMNRKIADIEKKLDAPNDYETFMGLCMTGRKLLSMAKVKPVMEYAENLLDDDRQVVIVSNFNDTLDAIKEKYGDEACFIRGGMTDMQKQQAIEDFQSGKKKICAMNIIAGGVGVTLTKAHDMIMVDFDWTPANMTQAEDRICRVGQDELCNIAYFYCDGSQLDEYFVNMLSEKSENIDKAVDNDINQLDLLGTLMKNKKVIHKADNVQEIETPFEIDGR